MTRTFAFRLTVLGVFVAACAAFAVFFVLRAGTHVPGVTVGHYRLAMTTDDVNGLVEDSEVRVAGVTVGRVTHLETGRDGRAQVDMTIDDAVVPLHGGLTARVGMKSLVGATFVDVVDGTGPALPSGTSVPPTSILPPVEIQDVIRGLDPPARRALSATVQSLGAATRDHGPDLARLTEGLGALGRDGHTALDAIAAQSDDLVALSRETTTLLDALDTSNGQIVDVLDGAQQIVGATAGQREPLERTTRTLPAVLDATSRATSSLEDLAGPLAPVAADLRAAAPDLDRALRALPGTSRDLRTLLPPLRATLDRAPPTLDRVPAVADDLSGFSAPTARILRDVNPALAYAAPYGRDIGAMLTNFASALSTNAENGVNPVRLAPILNDQSLRSLPLRTAGTNPLDWNNPYPTPGRAGAQQPFTGPYPRIERAPR